MTPRNDEEIQEYTNYWKSDNCGIRILIKSSYNMYMRFFLKSIPVLFFWGVFIFTILQVPYPEALIQSDTKQLLLFFIPLSLALIFTFNPFLKNIFVSFSISLGLIFLLILKALDALNLVTATMILFAVALLVSYFRKINRYKRLTNHLKIPKLTQLRKK